VDNGITNNVSVAPVRTAGVAQNVTGKVTIASRKTVDPKTTKEIKAKLSEWVDGENIEFTPEELKAIRQRRLEVLARKKQFEQPVTQSKSTTKNKKSIKIDFGSTERIKTDFDKRLARRLEKMAERRTKKSNP
jgi:hypothetical protein